MAGKFELSKGKSGKFSFNLKAGNGQVVFSSQTYDSKRSASAGINSVRRNAQKEARFERKESAKKQPYFVITAGNGQVIGKSQMYANLVSMEKGIQSVVRNAPEAPVVDLSVDDEKKAPAKKAAATKKSAVKKSTARKAAAKKATPGKGAAGAKAKRTAAASTAATASAARASAKKAPGAAAKKAAAKKSAKAPAAKKKAAAKGRA